MKISEKGDFPLVSATVDLLVKLVEYQSMDLGEIRVRAWASYIRIKVRKFTWHDSACSDDHYNDVIMGAIASEITSLASVYSAV